MNYISILVFLLLLITSCGNDGSPQNATESSPKEEVALNVSNQDSPATKALPTEPVAENSNSTDKASVKKNKVAEKIKPDPAKTLKNQPVEKQKAQAEQPKLIERPLVEAKPKPKENTPQVEQMNETTPVTKISEKPATKETDQLNKPAPFSHELLDQLLQKHVSANGKVNYKGLKSEQAKLEKYLDQLENTPIQSDWSKSKKMAYWINAYNAYTIKLILDNYPVSSITKLEGGKPWDKKWINLNGKTLSLNNIENDILRPQYQDARIHFAVNCAAKSCPPLLNRAWTEKNLNAYLDQQAKAFINNPQYNKISAGKVSVSKIFEWYAQDFGVLTDYLNQYSNTKINDKAKISYLEYDWALNE